MTLVHLAPPAIDRCVPAPATEKPSVRRWRKTRARMNYEACAIKYRRMATYGRPAIVLAALFRTHRPDWRSLGNRYPAATSAAKAGFVVLVIEYRPKTVHLSTTKDTDLGWDVKSNSMP